MKKALLFLGLSLYASLGYAQNEQRLVFNFASPRQTIHSFGASDCWRVQYIGKNWPIEKRNQIADLLFSSELDSWGNPKGIGLSMWRFNIGSGSHEAGDNGGVASLWRRAECFWIRKEIGIGINKRGNGGCCRPHANGEYAILWASPSPLPIL